MAITTKFVDPQITAQQTFQNQVNTAVSGVPGILFSSQVTGGTLGSGTLANFNSVLFTQSSIFSSSASSASQIPYVVPANRTAKVIFNPAKHITSVSGSVSHSALLSIWFNAYTSQANPGYAGTYSISFVASFNQTVNISKYLSVSFIVRANNYTMISYGYNVNTISTFSTIPWSVSPNVSSFSSYYGGTSWYYSSINLLSSITSLTSNIQSAQSFATAASFYLGPGDSIDISYAYLQLTNFSAALTLSDYVSYAWSMQGSTATNSVYHQFIINSYYWSQQTTNYDSWIMQDFTSLITIEEQSS